MTTARPCVGVVLAGGQSMRMGCDKALLTWQGQSLLERQMALLREAGAMEVRVSGARERFHGISDLLPLAGPVSGLAGVAQVLPEDVDLLIVPVDMPRLQAGLVRRLRVEKPQARSLVLAGRVLPMRLRCDAATRTVLVRLCKAAAPRQRSLRALQGLLGCQSIALSAAEAEQLLDCNTPETWDEAIRRESG